MAVFMNDQLEKILEKCDVGRGLTLTPDQENRRLMPIVRELIAEVEDLLSYVEDLVRASDIQSGKYRNEIERLQVSSDLLISMHEEVAKLRKQLELYKEQRDTIIRTWDTSTFSGVETEYKESIDELNAELEAIK